MDRLLIHKRQWKRYGLVVLHWLCIFIATSIVAFSLVRLMPGSPVDITLGSLGLSRTPENIHYVAVQYGLNQPLWLQYIHWIRDFLTGHWGISFSTKESLQPEMLRRLPLSLGLGLGGIVFAALLSFFLGFKAAIHERGAWDYITRGQLIFGQSIPVFVLALFVIYFIGVKFRLVSFFSGENVGNMTLGILFIAFPMIGPMTRATVAHFRETMRQPFMQYYIARGHNPQKALFRYGSRQAIYGLCAIVASHAAFIIGGTVVVEFALALPGLGMMLVDSISRRDYPMIQTYIMFVVLWLSFIHLLFDGIAKGLVGIKNEGRGES